MKRILFNDKYKLTECVLQGSKQTMRVICRKLEAMFKIEGDVDISCVDHVWTIRTKGSSMILPRRMSPRYESGEAVAIAQSFRDMGYNGDTLFWPKGKDSRPMDSLSGWFSKRNVPTEDLLRHIEITDVRLERLQDITDEECIQEGIIPYFSLGSMNFRYYVPGRESNDYTSPHAAFRAMVDMMHGKGTYDSNPYVYVYNFKRID